MIIMRKWELPSFTSLQISSKECRDRYILWSRELSWVLKPDWGPAACNFERTNSTHRSPTEQLYTSTMSGMSLMLWQMMNIIMIRTRILDMLASRRLAVWLRGWIWEDFFALKVTLHYCILKRYQKVKWSHFKMMAILRLLIQMYGNSSMRKSLVQKT